MPDDKDIHQEALETYDEFVSAENDARDRCVEDVRFITDDDGMWDPAMTAMRKGRPCYSIDKISLPINQILGDYLQNRIDGRVRAFDGTATAQEAEIYSGILRKIQSARVARNARDNSYKDIITGGFGAWRVGTEFANNHSFNQNIVIKPIYDPWFQVWPDVHAKDPNGRDDMRNIVEYTVSKIQFKLMFPEASTISVSSRTSSYQSSHNWFPKDDVRVAEYWKREEEQQEIVLMSNGAVYVEKDSKDVLDELAESGVTVADRRKVKRFKVKMYTINGNEVLKEAEEWAGQTIPIVKLYGNLTYVDRDKNYYGLVRKSKDSNQIYNFGVSSLVEATAAAPKDPFWHTPEQKAGHEAAWAAFNTVNDPFLPYNNDPTQPGPPQRSGPPAVQSSILSIVQQADFDIQATSGRFSPSLGDNPNDQSARALLAQQRQGDLGTYKYIDSLIGALEFETEIILELIPKIYDTPRLERLFKEDGTTEVVEINKKVLDRQTNKEVILNDLSKGEFDFTIDVVPSVKTQRLNSLSALESLSQTDPQIALLMADLRAENIDVPFSGELKKRIREFLVRSGNVKPTEEEVQAMQQDVQAQEQRDANNKIQKHFAMLQFQKLQAETQREVNEANKEAALIEKTQAETSRLIADARKKNMEANLPPSDLQNLSDQALADELIKPNSQPQGSPVPLNGSESQA